MEMTSQNAAARGLPTLTLADCDEELQNKLFDFCDAEDGNIGNGVSAADIISCWTKIGARSNELIAN